MLSMLRQRLTYANVISTLALFGVLAGGGAYAASKLGPRDIARDAVRSKHIKNGNLKAADLANASVRTNKLDDGAVNADKVAPDSLGGAQLDESTLRGIGPPSLAVVPAARAVQGAGQSTTVNDNGGATLSFLNEEYDTAEMHAPGATQLIAPIDGIYRISGQAAWLNAEFVDPDFEPRTEGSRRLGLRMNDFLLGSSDVAAAPWTAVGNNGAIQRQQVVATAELAAGDPVSLRAFVTESGSPIRVLGQDTWLEMEWIGPAS